MRVSRFSLIQVDGGRALLVACLAAGGFLGSWALIHSPHFSSAQLVDTPIYYRYAEALAHGQMPYRDFALDYPPLSLPAFIVPLLLHPGAGFQSYQQSFELLLAGCGAAAVGAAVFLLARCGAEVARLAVAVMLAAITPALLGSVILSRYDAWPALLTMGSLAAIASGRSRVGASLLALAVAAKGYPLALLPIVTVFVWRREGRVAASRCALLFVAVLAAILLPFALAAPHGLWSSLQGQGSRPLQVESLGASLLMTTHQVNGLRLSIFASHGSANIAGHLAGTVGSISGFVQLLAIGFVSLRFARGAASAARLLSFSAAVVCAFVVFDRVLSPQYLIWLVPLVITVPGPRGLVATSLLAAAMMLTQLWFPDRYFQLLAFSPLPSWLELGRNVLLLALLGVLCGPGSREPRADEAAPQPTRNQIAVWSPS